MSIQYWNNIEISDETRKRRSQIRGLMDEFMDFQWRGCSAFENFGAFIINEKKGGLKFYNGPGFSNEYSKPQFEANTGELMGVTFNRQTISFTIGVYWISIEHYRKMINWLDALVTDYIIFDFEPKYRYNVKLSKLGDSTRWIVGRENGSPRYYTELQLSFELQGAQCAKGVNSYEFDVKRPNGNSYISQSWAEDQTGSFYTQVKTKKINQNSLVNLDDFIPSDLSTPFALSLNLPLIWTKDDKDWKQANVKDIIKLVAVYGEDSNQEQHELFNVELQNLTYTELNESLLNNLTKEQFENLLKDNKVETLSINYNSETGLLFLSKGSIKKLLTLTSTTDSGQRLVASFASQKFMIPGKFEWNFNYDQFKLQVRWIRKIGDSILEDKPLSLTNFIYMNTGYIECYPRTNII